MSRRQFARKQVWRRDARAMPRTDPNTGRGWDGFLGTKHTIIIFQGGEMPGGMQILCACGETTWTPWGLDHAQEIGETHLILHRIKTEGNIKLR